MERRGGNRVGPLRALRCGTGLSGVQQFGSASRRSSSEPRQLKRRRHCGERRRARISTRRGNLLYIFREELDRRRMQLRTFMLGHAITHEIGHLLLGPEHARGFAANRARFANRPSSQPLKRPHGRSTDGHVGLGALFDAPRAARNEPGQGAVCRLFGVRHAPAVAGAAGTKSGSQMRPCALR